MCRLWSKILKSGVRPWTFTLALIFVGVMVASPASPADNPGDNSGKAGIERCGFHLAFSQAMFSGVNFADARSAMTMWIDDIARENHVVVCVDPAIHFHWESIERSLKDNRLDGAGMSAEEFWNVMPHVKLTRFIVGVKDGRTTEKYILLVHRDSGIRSIADLSGRSLLVLQNPRMSLAMIWLDTVLMAQGFPSAEHFCDHVNFETKPMQVVLPVFFRRADACLVTRQVFDVMNELNPQIGENLVVVCASPAVTPSAFGFKQFFTSPALDRFLSDVKQLKSTPAGRQVLTFLQLDSVVELPDSCLDSAFKLLTDYSRLKAHAIRGKK